MGSLWLLCCSLATISLWVKAYFIGLLCLQSPNELDPMLVVSILDFQNFPTFLLHKVKPVTINKQNAPYFSSLKKDLALSKQDIEYKVFLLFQYLVECMKYAAMTEIVPGDDLSDSPALHLLLGVRNFLLVLASTKVIMLLCLLYLRNKTKLKDMSQVQKFEKKLSFCYNFCSKFECVLIDLLNIGLLRYQLTISDCVYFMPQVEGIQMDTAAQNQILEDVLTCIETQFTINNDVSELNVKLASITSAFYLSLLKHWVR